MELVGSGSSSRGVDVVVSTGEEGSGVSDAECVREGDERVLEE